MALPDAVVVPVEVVVLGVVEFVVVVSAVDVPASVVVVVDAKTELETVIGAEVPEVLEKLSLISSAVVSASTSVTSTVATPSVKLTLLPVAQSPWDGYVGAVPSGASSGPEKVTH